MNVHTVGWGARRDERDHETRITSMIVYRYPLHAWLAQTAAEALCALTRHRFCNSRWGFVTVDQWVHDRIETFETQVPNSEIERFEAWRHGRPPYWVDDEGIEIGPQGYQRA